MKIIIILNVFNFNVLVLKAIGLLETKEFPVTFATIGPSVLIVFFLHKWIGRLACLRIDKHARLRLEILNLKIRGQYIFRQLLLQLLFNFLTESLVNLLVLWVEFSQNYQFKTSNNSGFGQFQ